MKKPEIHCIMCGVLFKRTGRAQKYCISCKKIAELERNKTYDRKRRATPHRKEWERKWRQTMGRERKKIRDYSYQKFRTLLLEKIGECEKCSSKKNLELHHHTYSKERSAVQLLCKKCHIKTHKR